MSSSPPLPNAHPVYRRDIDGLRAVAVLAVVFYHAFPAWGRGGFTGVNIFFVISGYLISTILFTGAAAGRLSYLDFYDRRIRRIFPALGLVLAACTVFAAVFGLPIETKHVGKEVVSGAGFVANLVSWNEAGYFDGASEFKPLLHLWSLSVEEQFYIFWPLVVAALFRHRRAFAGATALLLAASFAVNVSTVHDHPAASFFSPLSRFWELLGGSLLAWAKWRSSTPMTSNLDRREQIFRAPDLCSASGAASLCAGFALTNPGSTFPGWWALLPVVGTLLLIGAGPGAWLNARVLSNRALVFVGKISYQLYLWHWPLLAFPKILHGEASRNTRMGAVAIAVVLAWLTYRWVERPIRFGGTLGWRTSRILVGAVAALAACGAMLVASDGWVTRLPPEMRAIALAPIRVYDDDWRLRKCFLGADQSASDFAPECTAPPRPGQISVWLWGDSHAASMLPGLRARGKEGLALGVSQFTAAACPPALGFTVAQRPHCRAINDAVMKQAAAAPPDVVVLAANWTLYDGRGWERLEMSGLEKTLQGLRAAGVGEVIVVGQLPRWKSAQPTLLLREWKQTGRLSERSLYGLHSEAFAADGAVGEAARRQGAVFVSPLSRLCTAEGCLRTLDVHGDRVPFSWDDSHLTEAAAGVVISGWIEPIITDFVAARNDCAALRPRDGGAARAGPVSDRSAPRASAAYRPRGSACPNGS